jgi:hypothetical protein
VEDELTKNVDRLRRLFSKYLDENIVVDLQRFEADEYGATPDEIKKLIQSGNIIEIEDRFPDALKKIIHCLDQYACFIVDRNLIENPYNFQEVNRIDNKFSEFLYDKYREREGDYLLNWIGNNAKEPKSILQRFNFLSAYPADDMRSLETIKNYFDFGTFTEEQFFDKSNPDALKNLKDKIDNIIVLNIKYENRMYLDILRDNLNKKHKEDEEDFLNLLLEKDDKKRIGNNLAKIRILYEHILQELGETVQMKDSKDIIEELEKKGRCNKMLRNYCYSIWQICSDYGSHKNKKPETDRIFQPTLNTVMSLIYALKEIILWFGDQCDQSK